MRTGPLIPAFKYVHRHSLSKNKMKSFIHMHGRDKCKSCISDNAASAQRPWNDLIEV